MNIFDMKLYRHFDTLEFMSVSSKLEDLLHIVYALADRQADSQAFTDFRRALHDVDYFIDDVLCESDYFDTSKY